MHTFEVLVSQGLLSQLRGHTPYDTVWIHLALMAVERLQLLGEEFPIEKDQQ